MKLWTSRGWAILAHRPGRVRNGNFVDLRPAAGYPPRLHKTAETNQAIRKSSRSVVLRIQQRLRAMATVKLPPPRAKLTKPTGNGAKGDFKVRDLSLAEWGRKTIHVSEHE